MPPVVSPIGDKHTIRYWLTTLDQQPTVNGVTQPIAYPTAELPFTNVTFSKCWNQAGPFTATLNIEDEQVLNTNWINATNPGKSFFWVIIDNKAVFGGRILDRHYQLATQQVTITGTDFYGYWAQRLQAADYGDFLQTYGATTYAWAHAQGAVAAGAPAPLIAWQILQDAVGVTSSLPNLTAPVHGEGVGTKSDPDYWVANYLLPDNLVTFSAPIVQQQTIDSMLQQFIGMNGGPPGDVFNAIGIDVVTDVSLDGDGNPQATVNVCWPRYGQTAAEQGDMMRILDLSTVQDLEWHEDATSQATGLVEQTGAGGIMALVEFIDSTAIGTHNYPLTQQSVTHSSASPTGLSTDVLTALRKGDQDLYTYPQLTAVATVPVFSQGTGFSLTALPFGDDIGIFNPFERQGITGLPSVPFPPKGSPCVTPEIVDGVQFGVMRIVRADVTISDEGLSTMALTLNIPPGNPSPPGYLSS